MNESYSASPKRKERPFLANGLSIASVNENFRTILHTCQQAQIGVMSLDPNEDIGMESHEESQIFYVVQGCGRLIADGDTQEIREGCLIMVHPGTEHNLINDDGIPMKLITIYVPPHHPPGTVDVEKPLDKKL